MVVALLGLFVNPILLSALGSSGFGVWKACQRLVDFASVADGRATQALKWVIAHGSGKAGSVARRRAVAASVVVWGVSLPILLAIGGVLLLAMPSLVKTSGAVSDGYLRTTAAILFLNVVLAGLLMIPDSVLVGVNAGYRSMHVTTTCFVVTNVGMCLAVWAGLGVVSLAVVTVAGAVANGLLTYVAARRHVPWLGASRPTRTDVFGMARFSGWVLVWSLVSKLLLASELVLLGALVGPESVTAFTFSSYIYQFALAMCLLGASAAMPYLGSLVGEGRTDDVRLTVVRVREQTLALCVVLASLMLIFNRSFVTVWAGKENYIGDSANILLVLGFVQLVTIRNDAQIQDTSLLIGRKVMIGVAACALSLLAAILLFRLHPSVESILSGLIAGRLLASVSFPLLVKRMAPSSSVSLQRWLGAGVMLMGSTLVGLQTNLRSAWLLALLALPALPVVAAAAYMIILSDQSRQSAKEFVGIRRRKRDSGGSSEGEQSDAASHRQRG